MSLKKTKKKAGKGAASAKAKTRRRSLKDLVTPRPQNQAVTGGGGIMVGLGDGSVRMVR